MVMAPSGPPSPQDAVGLVRIAGKFHPPYGVDPEKDAPNARKLS